MGGAAVTEEFLPGFRNSLAAYTVSLLHPQVIRDLRPAEHGLHIVERPMLNFAPQPDGSPVCVGNTLAETKRSLAAHSRRDAERLPAYAAVLERAVSVLRELVPMTPPNAGGGLAQLPRLLRMSRTWLRMSLEEQRDVHELFSRRSVSSGNSACSAATFPTARWDSTRCSLRAPCSASRTTGGRCVVSTCAAPGPIPAEE